MNPQWLEDTLQICFDFDGVIHAFSSPWEGEDVIADEPIDGCREALVAFIRMGAKIYIHSVRCRTYAGRKAIESYMNFHNLPFDEVVEHKPVANFYIDDRGVPFSGDWQSVIGAVYKQGD
jgi:hypothetical protein